MLRLLKKKFKRILFERKNSALLNLNWIDTKKVENVTPNKIETICFIIPGIIAFSGGITSILRLGSFLDSFGYNVSYACYDNQPVKFLKCAAEKCLPEYKGEILRLCDVKKNYDIVIASNAISMYYAKKLNGYKMAFVQDYEPFFFEAGDYNLIARKAYELGFHMVSLGTWNKYMIQKYIDSSLKLDTISFPYEKKEYPSVERNYLEYREKQEFNLCVYIRETPRRLPGLCQFISKNLIERFEAAGKKFNIFYYGETVGEYQYGKNLGQLNKSQLFELYKKCDFGMVASYTNISLVPYEMMATGLPIIEFVDGSFQYFFDKDDAFLFDFDYDQLFYEIQEAIENPIILVERNEKIQQKLSMLSWGNTAKEFEKILKKLIQQ